jgi:hypothetical protein
MKTPIKDHQQKRVTGGEQKVILDPAETGETDELDPDFDEDDPKPEPGDDPSTELI